MNYASDPNALQMRDIWEVFQANLPAFLEFTGFPKWLMLWLLIAAVGWILGHPLFRQRRDHNLAADVLAVLWDCITPRP